MAEDRISESFVLIVTILALAGVVLVAVSFATRTSMWGMMGGGGGMMQDGEAVDAGPGGVEWIVLGASAALFVASVAMLFRGRSVARRADRFPAARSAAATDLVPPTSAPVVSADAPGIDSELTLVKLLGDDERQMYLEIRERGGEALQRDLVAMGTFSKAKVTRVLDKLEAKGLVVRERHGMTNRVRLTVRTGR